MFQEFIGVNSCHSHVLCGRGHLYNPRCWDGLPGASSGKEPACQCRRHRRCGSIPGLGRLPEVRHGEPLQYSCLENPMGRGAERATVHGVTQGWTWLSTRYWDGSRSAPLPSSWMSLPSPTHRLAPLTSVLCSNNTIPQVFLDHLVSATSSLSPHSPYFSSSALFFCRAHLTSVHLGVFVDGPTLPPAPPTPPL